MKMIYTDRDWENNICPWCRKIVDETHELGCPNPKYNPEPLTSFVKLFDLPREEFNRVMEILEPPNEDKR